MQMKKVYTMIPFCSLGDSECAVRHCYSCDAAKEVKPHPMMVGNDCPVPINCGIDKTDVDAGEDINVWVEYDLPIDPKKVKLICGKGLTFGSMEITNKGTRVEYVIKSGLNALGNRNITVAYNSVARVFNINVRKGYPRIVDTRVSSSSIKVGEKIVVGYVLGRPLEPGDKDPEIMFDTEMFIMTDTPKRSAINDVVYAFTLQSCSREGETKVSISYPGSGGIHTINIYRDPDMEFATEEDIDGLFPELDDEPDIPEPDVPEIPDIPDPPVPTPPEEDDRVYATESDIDALFPELI